MQALQGTVLLLFSSELVHLQEAPQCMFSLNAFSDGSSSSGNMRTNKHQLQVTSVSWSKTGQTLAASFGRWAGTRQCQLAAIAAQPWCCFLQAIRWVRVFRASQ
eukprot:GHRQ01030640.1.p1 GENE.GHRQ01030640.1~~GHRQ01030640.1.p1  ORF type:complete len:104 (-),score=24.97 GHRQ01030640.1:668-979(-)